jgi:hypothetical protein
MKVRAATSTPGSARSFGGRPGSVIGARTSPITEGPGSVGSHWRTRRSTTPSPGHPRDVCSSVPGVSGRGDSGRWRLGDTLGCGAVSGAGGPLGAGWIAGAHALASDATKPRATRGLARGDRGRRGTWRGGGHPPLACADEASGSKVIVGSSEEVASSSRHRLAPHEDAVAALLGSLLASARERVLEALPARSDDADLVCLLGRRQRGQHGNRGDTAWPRGELARRREVRSVAPGPNPQPQPQAHRQEGPSHPNGFHTGRECTQTASRRARIPSRHAPSDQQE